MRLLIVEDSDTLADALCRGLQEEGFAVDRAADGIDGLHMAQTTPYDLIVLDLMLPGIDGFQVLETLRAEGNSVPVVFLTARNGVQDRIRGLQSGGDDYLAKPFSFEELLSRIRAVLRRASNVSRNFLRWNQLEMDMDTRTVAWDGVPVPLTPKESQLLEMLLLNSGKTLARSYLIHHVYDYSFECDSNVIDAHIANLRKKLLAAAGKPLIETVRGVGFRLPKVSV